ncbi:hypothetical protein GYH30_011369 [Glycine max]|nr:hypothetical protein GYH30_011369 [Glycine max]
MGLNDDLVVAIHPSHLWASFICGTDKLKLQTNKKKKVMTLSFLKLVYSSVATLLSPSLKLYGFLLSRMIWKVSSGAHLFMLFIIFHILYSLPHNIIATGMDPSNFNMLRAY